LHGSEPGDVTFRSDPTATISAFAVTVERAGGVACPSHVPVCTSGPLST